MSGESRTEVWTGQRGHLLVGQSGGPTAVINASLAGIVHEAMAHDEIDGIYGVRFGVRGLLDGDIIDLRQQATSVWDIVARTPSAALGSCRYRLSDDDAQRVIQMLRQFGIRYFLYIGGNDSADTALRLTRAAAEAHYDLQVICVPKTIDNDLPETDHCPGFGSAARFVALATRDSALCTRAMPDHFPVKVIEVMGRDAGWLAAAATLGRSQWTDPPHLIYLPEFPLHEAQFLADVTRVHAERGYVIAVVAETVRDESGRSLGSLQSQGSDAFGHPLVGGAAQYLLRRVRELTGLRARYDKPGDLQRMSSAAVSETDFSEAEQTGRAAVLAALTGRTGTMVGLARAGGQVYDCTTTLVPLERVANRIRPIPSEFLTADGRDVTDAFRQYATPLLGSPLPVQGELDFSRRV